MIGTRGGGHLTHRRVLLAATVGVLALALLVSQVVSQSEGPYGRVFATRWDASGIPTEVGTLIVLGGAPITDSSKQSWPLIAVRPTNMPQGLEIVGARGMSVPPALGIGPLSWTETIPHQPFLRLPSAVSQGAEEPVLIVKATVPGKYVIDGLLVTYRWNGDLYADYARTQFVVCAYATAALAKASSCTNAGISPPPPTYGRPFGPHTK